MEDQMYAGKVEHEESRSIGSDDYYGGRRRRRVEGMKVVVCMVVVQVAVAGMTVLYKISVQRGMSFLVLIAYRYIFGAALLCPLAFFLERKKRTRLTWVVVGQAFCSSLFGATLNQNLYIASIKMGSATLAVAISNLLPAFTFLFAVLFRMEKIQMRMPASQAKIIGTLIGIGGAMLLTFCKGAKLHIWSFHAHLVNLQTGSAELGNLALGSLLATANTLCCAIWFIIQAKMSERYPYPYTNTALLNLIAAIQCTAIAAAVERDASAWKLRWDVNLFTIVYVGFVISGIVLLLVLWGIQKRGPLFVSIFNPLSLIIVALFGSLFLEEPLHLGSVLGIGLIILGLYTVLWGKGKEVEEHHRPPPQMPTAGESVKQGLDGVHPVPLEERLEESRKKERDMGDQVASGSN